MGCVSSRQERPRGSNDSLSSTTMTEEKARNRLIEQEIKQHKAELRTQVKLLLLGSGESGKSTILKQMKLIHEGGYSLEARLTFKSVVFSNTVQSMRAILEAMEAMDVDVSFGDGGRGAEYKHVVLYCPIQFEEGSNRNRLPPAVVEAIRELWKDENVLGVYSRNQEYQLNDSAKYFFDSIDRIGSADYVPTDQDVLRTRVKTTGITESTFRIGELTYTMFDVGGQRSERKKWIHCFENVMALIYMVALSEFDQVLIEDEATNRMEEALMLFGSIVNSRWFKNTSIILFLNKIDIFREKIESGRLLSHTFPDYAGLNTVDSTSQYLLKKFTDLNVSKNKQIYTHFTCATDTEQVKFVMVAVNDIIVLNNLRDVGLL